jgi:hypothetical protein
VALLTLCLLFHAYGGSSTGRQIERCGLQTLDAAAATLLGNGSTRAIQRLRLATPAKCVHRKRGDSRPRALRLDAGPCCEIAITASVMAARLPLQPQKNVRCSVSRGGWMLARVPAPDKKSAGRLLELGMRSSLAACPNPRRLGSWRSPNCSMSPSSACISSPQPSGSRHLWARIVAARGFGIERPSNHGRGPIGSEVDPGDGRTASSDHPQGGIPSRCPEARLANLMYCTERFPSSDEEDIEELIERIDTQGYDWVKKDQY